MTNLKYGLYLPACSLAVLLSACGGGGGAGGGNGDFGNQDLNLGAATEQTPISSSTAELAVPAQFDWSNNNEIELDLMLYDADGLLAPGTGVTVYAMPENMQNENTEPTDTDLLLANKLFSGVSDNNGAVQTTLQVPGHVISNSRIYVKTKLFGVTSSSVVPLDTIDTGGRKASWVFGPTEIATLPADEVDPNMLQNDQGLSLNSRNSPFNDQGNVSAEYYLNPFFSYYHWFYGHMPATASNNCNIFDPAGPTLCRSAVSKDQLVRLNDIVAEGTSPSEKYLNADSSQSNLIFSKKANVVVTFLHEDAGHKNTFGYFTYNSGAEPTVAGNLDTDRILFPNTSYRGSGGYMRSGDSVYLGEFDPAAGDDAIGFFVAADGWNHNRGMGRDGQHFYSLESLNPEDDVDDRKHMLLIANDVDDATNTRRLWVASEDIRLDSGHSDRDYNDLIMQIDVFPADALVFGEDIPDTINEDDVPNDADNDGIVASNDIDDNDPERAFERYYPGEKTWGTLLAEDNWPLLGDFDMNDMVVRYRTREVFDSNKRVKDVTIEYRLEARGAAFHNGFAVSFGDGVFSDNIEQAELNGEPIQPLADATYLAYEIFGDTWAHTFEGDEICWTYNTMSDCPTYPATDFQLDLTFANSVERSDLIAAPYNPFLFAHKTGIDVPGYTRNNALSSDFYTENGAIRDIEIHLPYMPPTQGQDVAMFGTGDDSTDGVERFYVSGDNLPWIIDIPDAVVYPEEFVDIGAAYPAFSEWVQSGGTDHQDWYQHMADDDAMIYQGPSEEGEPTLAAAEGKVVSDNFQDQQFIPFNLQVRNTTGSAVRWEALVANVGYASVPNLNLNGTTLVTSDNGDGTFSHLFSGTSAPFQNTVISGGIVEPVGTGSGLSLYAE